MIKQTSTVLSLSLALAFAAGCQPKADAPPPPPAVAAPPVPAPAAAAPAPASKAAAPAPSAAVDLDKIAISTVALPPFPFIDYPAGITAKQRAGGESAFDQTSIIVGNQLHTVEGRFKITEFSNADAGISRFQATRDYNKAALDLGGVKVNTVAPDDKGFIDANGGDFIPINKKLRAQLRHSYDAYLIPTAAGRNWIVVMVSDGATRILSIEEEQAASSVKLVSAEAMKSELDAKGRVALYINFDTDKASIRPDGKPAVDEIATLLKNNPSLKLSIEGHTDATGEAKRNKELSTQRAQAVAAALKNGGIDQARLSATGHGADQPLAPNTDEAGRAKNRRVELVKVAGG